MSTARMSPAYQRGMSLISLMIALTIGALLLAGLFDIWIQTKQTFNSQKQLGVIQDNARTALTIMSNTVQTGGYYPVYLNFSTTPPSPLYSAANMGTMFPAGATFPGTAVFNAGQTIYGVTLANGSDELDVRYLADPGTLDCQGQTEKTGTIVLNTYTVGADGNLQCAVDGNTPLDVITSANTRVGTGALQSMTILYGISTTGAANSANQYMTATQVAANTDWPNVRSVAIQLIFTNPLYGQPGQTIQPTTLPHITRIVALTQTTPTT